MMTHRHTLEPGLDPGVLFLGSYILYNLQYLKWDIGFLPLLPESLCECVCLQTNDYFFASHADGSKSMSSHKISVSATKLYRTIMVPDALCGKSEQLAYFFVSLPSCIYLTTQLLRVVPSLLS